jgi:hypothetical protein
MPFDASANDKVRAIVSGANNFVELVKMFMNSIFHLSDVMTSYFRLSTKQKMESLVSLLRMFQVLMQVKLTPKNLVIT